MKTSLKRILIGAIFFITLTARNLNPSHDLGKGGARLHRKETAPGWD
jgi:hypothetical protein